MSSRVLLIFCFLFLFSLCLAEEDMDDAIETIEIGPDHYIRNFGSVNGWECYNEDDKRGKYELKFKKGDKVFVLWASIKGLRLVHKQKSSPFIVFIDRTLAHYGKPLFIVRADEDRPKVVFMAPFSWDVPVDFMFHVEESNKEILKAKITAEGIQNSKDLAYGFNAFGFFEMNILLDKNREAIDPPLLPFYLEDPFVSSTLINKGATNGLINENIVYKDENKIREIGLINGWECFQEEYRGVYNLSRDKTAMLKFKKGDRVFSLWGSLQWLTVIAANKESPYIVFCDHLSPNYGNVVFVVKVDFDGPKIRFMSPFSWDFPMEYAFRCTEISRRNLEGVLEAKGIVVNQSSDARSSVMGYFWCKLSFDEDRPLYLSFPAFFPYRFDNPVLPRHLSIRIPFMQTHSSPCDSSGSTLSQNNMDTPLLVDVDAQLIQDKAAPRGGPTPVDFDWEYLLDNGWKIIEITPEDRKKFAENKKKNPDFELNESRVEFPLLRCSIISPSVRYRELEEFYLQKYNEDIYPYFIATPRKDVLIMMTAMHKNPSLCKLDVLQKKHGEWVRKKRFIFNLSPPEKRPAKIMMLCDTVNVYTDEYKENLGYVEVQKP